MTRGDELLIVKPVVGGDGNPFGGAVGVDSQHGVATGPWLCCIARVHVNAAVTSELARCGSAASKQVVLGQVAAVVSAALIEDAVRAEGFHELHVGITKADVAFPTLRGSVQAQGWALLVFVTGDYAVLAAAGGHVRARRIQVVAPVLLLAQAAQDQVSKRRVALVGADRTVNLRLHSGIPIAVGCGAVGAVVVVGVRLDDRVDLGGAVQDVGVEELLRNARRIQILRLVLREVLFAFAGDLLTTVGKAINETRGRHLAALALVGTTNHRGVDLLDLIRVFNGLGGLLRLGQGREQETNEQGDDGHDHQQLDERKCALLHVQ